MQKCIKQIEVRFDEKKWGSKELRKIVVTLEGSVKDETIKERISELFSKLEENPPTDRLKDACAENQRRAGGKLLDRARYTPNPPLTPEAKEIAREFANTCMDGAWEAELHPFGEKDIIRWVTTKEITIAHLRELVKFYASNEKFKDRIVELHTGAHCTE